MAIGWFETHAHLSDAQFNDDRSACLDRAWNSGLEGIVEIADGPSEWPHAQQLARENKGKIWWSAGIHPYYSAESADRIEDLGRQLSDNQLVAIGEIGLDYAKCPVPPQVQQATFEKLLDLAGESQKPMVIHCREAFQDLWPILERRLPKDPSISPGVIHCFSGNSSDALRALKLGFFIGVDAPVMYPKAEPLRLTLKGVPLDRIVLETDSPYLPPQTHRGKRNEPSYLPLIGRHLAEVLQKPVESVSEITTSNARLLYRLKTVR